VLARQHRAWGQGDTESCLEELDVGADVGNLDRDPAADTSGGEGLIDDSANPPSRREVNERGVRKLAELDGGSMRREQPLGADEMQLLDPQLGRPQAGGVARNGDECDVEGCAPELLN
jgi:hypothetical protein